MKRVALIAALLAAGAPFARADEAVSPADRDRARREFERGQAAYAAGDYRTAIEAYIAAYRLAPFPELVFDIGQAQRLAGHDGRALEAYQMYLQEAPTGALAAEARAHVLELESRGVAASDDLQRSSHGESWADLATSIHDARDASRAEEAEFERTRQQYVVGLVVTSFEADHDQFGAVDGPQDGTGVAVAAGIHRRLTRRLTAEPRVTAGTIFGTSSATTVVRAELQGAFLIQVTSWLELGPAVGIGWSNCAEGSTFYDDHTSNDYWGCVAKLLVTSELDVTASVRRRYEVGLQLHPSALGNNDRPTQPTVSLVLGLRR
ncbi:MAG TPA: tetratricopeptide repeat protein [Kofleriaceae bacterium]|nr:tetratricopeptide repeat protein [Kofleriaceae bacterium]